MSVLQPGWVDTCKHFFPVNCSKRWTHLRINYLPDGGIARVMNHSRLTVQYIYPWSREVS